MNDRRLFVTSESSGTVYEVPLLANGLPAAHDIHTLPGAGAAHGVVVDANSHLAFVSRSEVNFVEVFDPNTLQTVKSIAVPDDVDGIFDDPRDRLIYAVSGDAGMATLIDPGKRAKVATFALGGTTPNSPCSMPRPTGSTRT